MKEKCIICESGHSTWVNEQHDAGLSTRQIAAELKEKFGLSASHVTIASHLNHGNKSDRMAVLEARIRNLERWMSQALPGSPFVIWVPKLSEPGVAHHQNIYDRAAYLTTIPNAEALEAEVTAIRTTISAGMDEEEFERDRQQKEIWAREKSEKDRLAKIVHDEQEAAQKKASEEAKRIEIEEMRKSVEAYDNGEASK